MPEKMPDARFYAFAERCLPQTVEEDRIRRALSRVVAVLQEPAAVDSPVAFLEHLSRLEAPKRSFLVKADLTDAVADLIAAKSREGMISALAGLMAHLATRWSISQVEALGWKVHRLVGGQLRNSEMSLTRATVGGPSMARGGLRLFVQPGDASVADIRRVLQALNALDLAYGGDGLSFSLEGGRLQIAVRSV